MFFNKKETTAVTNWNMLEKVEDLDKVDESSKSKPALIFKHSTRCSISSMMLSKFERNYQPDANFDVYFLDLIANRDVSNAIESRYNVRHESPQSILIKDGQVIHHTSHMGISFDELNNASIA